MWLSKYILITLFLTNIILITNSKLKSNSNLSLESKSSLRLVQTASIQVFKDKELTNKLYSFEGISFDLEKSGKLIKGIKFDLSKMTNKESADNFFGKVAKKIAPGIYFLFFSSLPGCEILGKKNPAISLNVVQISIVSPASENFYISFSFAEGESAVEKYSSEMHDACNSYSNSLKTKLSEFYEMARNYFKVKKEKENVKAKDSIVTAKNEKQMQALESSNTDKKIQSDKLDKNKIDLDQSTREKNELEKELKRKYTELNNLKAEKAKYEKDMEDLKKQSDAVSKDIDQAKNTLESFEKAKEDKRVQLEVHNAQLSDTQKKIQEMDKTLNDKKSELKKVSDELLKVNTQVAEAQSGFAESKLRINTEQETVDNLNNADSQRALKDKNKLVDDLQKKLDELRKELADINREASEFEEIVKKNNDDVNNVLNDPAQKIQAKKEELTKIMIEIKQYLDYTKKLFPLLPDIYWDNIWRFVSVNHSESLNYLKGMRPSIFGIYDNLYTMKHPEKTINDVDFVPRPLPEVIAKAKKLKKRKL